MWCFLKAKSREKLTAVFCMPYLCIAVRMVVDRLLWLRMILLCE